MLTDLAGNAVAIHEDGKIVTAGGYAHGHDFALARYTNDGRLDPSFGNDGKVLTDFAENYAADAIAIQPDGRIVATGSPADNRGDHDFALARYTPDGSLDPSFGSGGKVLTHLGSSSADGARAVAIQADGKLVAAGYSSGGEHPDYFALASYTADGRLDPSFRSGGKVLTDLGPGYDEAYAVAIQEDGKLVVAGSGNARGRSDFALARYNPDGSLDS